jgi:hypothetical protein
MKPEKDKDKENEIEAESEDASNNIIFMCIN